MLRAILRYGLIAGLVVAGFEVATFTAFSGMPPLEYGLLIGYTTGDSGSREATVPGLWEARVPALVRPAVRAGFRSMGSQ